MLPPVSVSMGLLFLALIAATLTDIKSRRIPNVLCLGLIIAGLFLQMHTAGLEGLWTGMGGMVAGLIVFLPFYLGGGMGAGDVKLMAAAGSFFSPMTALLAACLTLIAGGIMAMLFLVMKQGKGVRISLHRYGLMLRCLLTTGRVNYIPPQPDEAAAGRFPYAAAIAVGVLATLIWLPK